MQVERAEIIEILQSSYLFNGLTEEQIANITDKVQAFLYPQDQTIFEQNSVSDYFYFIYSGKVQLTHHSRNKEQNHILSERDYFGQEIFADTPVPRKATAIARTDVILLRFSKEVLFKIKQEYPLVELPLKQALKSYNVFVSLSTPWRGPREVIQYIDHPHPFFLIAKMIPPVVVSFLLILVLTYLNIVVFAGSTIIAILLAVALIGGVAWIILSAIDFFNDYAVVTNRRIAFLRKVLLVYDSRQEIPLDAILADDVRTTQLGRMLGYGDVLIRTYTGELTLFHLAYPYLVLETINKMRERAKENKNKSRLDEIDVALRQRIFGERIPGVPEIQDNDEVEPIQTLVKSGALTMFLTNLFGLRTEENGVITYRTHWSILINKIWLPTLALFALIILTMAVLFRSLDFDVALTLLAGSFLGPALLLWWLYQYVDWRNDCYVITADTIIDVYRKPLGVEQKRTSPIKNILSIDFERIGILGLILNFGTVYIRVGDATLTFDNVFAPSDVQRELFQRIIENKRSEEERMEKSINNQLGDWIEHYHQMMQTRQANSGEDDTR